MRNAPTAKQLILNLLRAAAPQPLPVRAIVAVGEWFDITGNALRVALARMGSAGLVESDERGSYRLTAATDPMSRFIERWRSGEARVRPWSGAWLAVLLPPGTPRSERARSQRVLHKLGFRESDDLHVRPDNLAWQRAELHERAGALGLEPGAHSLVISDADAELDARWRTLWDTESLRRSYQSTCRQLARSTERLNRVTPAKGAPEAFVVGGDAIRVLVTDPLLPAELLGGSELRAELARAMLDYDALGRSVLTQLMREAEGDGEAVALAEAG